MIQDVSICARWKSANLVEREQQRVVCGLNEELWVEGSGVRFVYGCGE
jgi:hypothetical protein